MSELLELIRSLEQAGRWAEIRTSGESFLASADASERARVLLALSKAWEETAAGVVDYRTAVRYTVATMDAAGAGSFLHVWALHRLACQLSDLGDFAGAERAAQGFFAALPDHPRAEAVVPWVNFHMGRIRYHQRSYPEAAMWFERAAAAGDGELRERAVLFLVWARARAGHLAQAAEVLPESVQHVSDGHLRAAKAFLYACASDWPHAAQEARSALRHFSAGEWRVFDIVQAAELCLILKNAAHAMGERSQAMAWMNKAAALLSRWNLDLLVDLVLTLRVEGGGSIDAAASHRGPAGHHRCGTRGSVG
ncbi:MAG: tetratricopeptide repeat protein [Chitinophagales bacterium]